MQDVALALAAEQHGLVTRRQLRRLGLSRAAVLHLSGSGRWAEESAEVLRLVGAPRTVEQRVLAAVLDAGPGARLSHASAGRWWGATGCRLRPVQVVRTGAPARPTRLAVVHRVRRLPDGWTTVHRGVPVVRPELLSMQLFATCSPGRAARLTDRLWSERLLSGRSLRRFLQEYGCRGRNGTAGVRSYLERRPDDYVPPASGLESRCMDVLERADIVMRRQVESGGDDHWTGRVDFRHAVLPLVVEVQSSRFHASLCDREADDRRLAQLALDGFLVVEVTDTMVWSDPGGLVELVRRAVRAAHEGRTGRFCVVEWGR